MSQDTYSSSFEGFYGLDNNSGTALLDAPADTPLSSLDNMMLDEVEGVVTTNQTLARDFTQYSAE